MVIKSLELTNFRNFELRKLVFSSRNVFLTGINGSGKSNILESIALSSLLRSFRGAASREMIRIGAREFQLKTVLAGKYGDEILQISEDISGRRKLFINGEVVRRSSDFIREFHTVVFAPEDRLIISGTSGLRRRFFDILLSELNQEYLLRLSRYHRALSQRNRALKTVSAMASSFDGELAEQAPFISGYRRKFAGEISRQVNSLLADRGEFRVVYRSDSGETPEEHLAILRSRKESELRRQCTLSGPQLDEFDLFFNDKLLRTYGSTGQVRLLGLLLKLAEFRILKGDSSLPVAVLVDDVTGELDEFNLDLFLSGISDADQCFFTFADEPHFTLPDSGFIAVDRE